MTFKKGEKAQTITLKLNDDTEMEGKEGVIITLQPSAKASIQGDAQMKVTLVDDEGISFGKNEYEVIEGKELSIQLSKKGDPGKSNPKSVKLIVKQALQDKITQTAGEIAGFNYSTLAQGQFSVHFAKDSDQALLKLKVDDNDKTDGERSFNMEFDSESLVAAGLNVDGTESTTVKILDNEPVISFAKSNVTTRETDSNKDLSVQYIIDPPPVQAGKFKFRMDNTQDMTPNPTPGNDINYAPGQASGTITINVKGDDKRTGYRIASLELLDKDGNPMNHSKSKMKVTVEEDEGLIEFDQPTSECKEGNECSISIQAPGFPYNHKINYDVQFISNSEFHTFDPPDLKTETSDREVQIIEETGVINFTLEDNNGKHEPENFIIKFILKQPSGEEYGPTRDHEIRIKNIHGIGFEEKNIELAEDYGEREIKITTNQQFGGGDKATLQLAIINSASSEGTDYTIDKKFLDSRLEFKNGKTSQTVKINTLHDKNSTKDKILILRLTDAQGTIIHNGELKIIIKNIDGNLDNIDKRPLPPVPSQSDGVTIGAPEGITHPPITESIDQDKSKSTKAFAQKSDEIEEIPPATIKKRNNTEPLIDIFDEAPSLPIDDSSEIEEEDISANYNEAKFESIHVWYDAENGESESKSNSYKYTGDQQIVIYMRHAETECDKTKNLSRKGQKRSRALARSLSNITIDSVYSTQTCRTLQTIQPLLQSHPEAKLCLYGSKRRNLDRCDFAVSSTRSDPNCSELMDIKIAEDHAKNNNRVSLIIGHDSKESLQSVLPNVLHKEYRDNSRNRLFIKVGNEIQSRVHSDGNVEYPKYGEPTGNGCS